MIIKAKNPINCTKPVFKPINKRRIPKDMYGLLKILANHPLDIAPSILTFILSIIIFILPPYQKLLTYLHEIGHCIHNKLFTIHYKLPKNKSKILPFKQNRKYPFLYESCTKNDTVYFCMINKNKYKSIKIQAIFGSAFVISINTLLFLLLLQLNYPKYLLYHMLPIFNCTIELTNFFTSSDFTYFKNPSTFTIEKYLKSINKYK